MSYRKYKLAIVGYGGMGYWHSHLLKDVDSIEVVGAYDIREERLRYAEENDIYAFNTFQEVLEDKSIDIILCATPNDTHKSIAIEALNAGKNVICEKPAAMNSNEFREMMKAAETNNRLLVVHQNRRWDNDYLSIKQLVKTDTLGNVYRIESRVHGSRGIPGDWRKEKNKGGGMLFDWGVHIIDQALQMIPFKVKEVYADFFHYKHEDVDDGFSLILTFENNVQFLLEVGTKNFIKLPRWYVIADNGSAVIEDWNQDLQIIEAKTNDIGDAIPIRTAAGLTKTMAPRSEDSIFFKKIELENSDVLDFYRNVTNYLNGSTDILVKNEEVLRVLQLMETAVQSFESKKILSFE